MLMIVCFTAGTANAQFGKLKKLAKKAESVVKDKKIKERKEEIKAAVDGEGEIASVKGKVEEAKTKAQLEDYEYIYSNWGFFDDKSVAFKGDNLGMYAAARKTDWNDLQANADNGNYGEVIEANALYYLYRFKKAVESGDTELMTGDFLDRTTWCVSMISSMKKNGAVLLRIKDFKAFGKEYNDAIGKFKAILWEGEPKSTHPLYTQCKTPEDFAAYRKGTVDKWNWTLKRAQEYVDAGKPRTAEYFLMQLVGTREVALGLERFKGNEPEFVTYSNNLSALYAKTSSEFQKKNPFLTPEQAVAKQKGHEERWAKEAAERKAKEEAEIAANTQAWPKSNMPELHAQIMSILKAKFPGRKIYRVSVMNDHWNVMYKGLVPERRVVQYWMEYDHKSGRRIAEEHYVCQYYNGNGYGKMQYQGQGSRYFWVAQ